MHTVFFRFIDILIPDAAFSNIDISVCIYYHEGVNKMIMHMQECLANSQQHNIQRLSLN